jgi:predicted ATPase
MLVQRLILKNWRNFRQADIPLRDVTYLVGANATGKSNLLDVFRFLRDICKPKNGGLRAAVEERGGISELRCLHARRDPEVRTEVHIADTSDDKTPTWRYSIGFKPEGMKGQ